MNIEIIQKLTGLSLEATKTLEERLADLRVINKALTYVNEDPVRALDELRELNTKLTTFSERLNGLSIDSLKNKTKDLLIEDILTLRKEMLVDLGTETLEVDTAIKVALVDIRTELEKITEVDIAGNIGKAVDGNTLLNTRLSMSLLTLSEDLLKIPLMKRVFRNNVPSTPDEVMIFLTLELPTVLKSLTALADRYSAVIENRAKNRFMNNLVVDRINDIIKGDEDEYSLAIEALLEDLRLVIENNDRMTVDTYAELKSLVGLETVVAIENYETILTEEAFAKKEIEHTDVVGNLTDIMSTVNKIVNASFSLTHIFSNEENTVENDISALKDLLSSDKLKPFNNISSYRELVMLIIATMSSSVRFENIRSKFTVLNLQYLDDVESLLSLLTDNVEDLNKYIYSLKN